MITVIHPLPGYVDDPETIHHPRGVLRFDNWGRWPTLESRFQAVKEKMRNNYPFLHLFFPETILSEGEQVGLVHGVVELLVPCKDLIVVSYSHVVHTQFRVEVRDGAIDPKELMFKSYAEGRPVAEIRVDGNGTLSEYPDDYFNTYSDQLSMLI